MKEIEISIQMTKTYLASLIYLICSIHADDSTTIQQTTNICGILVNHLAFHFLHS